MANTVLTIQMVAKEALRVLNNNLVMAKLVNRAYEAEFPNAANGYRAGASINIRKPSQFVVRQGAVASPQDVVEGSTNITVGTQIGCEFKFTSQELTLQINQISERIIVPQMVRLANQIDVDLMTTAYRNCWNWVGTPGTTIAGFAGLARAPQRLDEGAVPTDSRQAVLSPADYWSMVGSFTNFTAQNATAETALRKASIGMVGNMDTYAAQNVFTHTVGTKAGAGAVNGAGQIRTFGGDGTVASNNVNNTAGSGTLVKDTNQQTLITNGWTASSAILNAGDVFTLPGVFAINPVTKAQLSYLQQFVVISAASSDGSGNATLTISPAIITTGAFQTVSAAPASGALFTVLGTAGTQYVQNLAFHKQSIALAVVPMELPGGAVKAVRESYDGLSVRVIEGYDFTNDINSWRLDVLYGTKTIRPEFITRISG